jgi:ferrochelatase
MWEKTLLILIMLVPCGISFPLLLRPMKKLQQPGGLGSVTLSPPATKIGVVFLNLGGPESLADVEPFLFNLFSDPDIIRLPALVSRFFQRPLARFISSKRAPKSERAYASIGGGSPILAWTQAQAGSVKARLALEHGVEAEMYIAMRYSAPFTEDAVVQMKRDGISHAIVVPLYPHYSLATTSSSLRALQACIPTDMKVTVIPSWHKRQGYLEAMAQLIVKEVKALPEREAHILFSAHGVPESYIASGDPYKCEIEECYASLSHRVTQILAREEKGYAVEGSLSYQSRVGPVHWLKPYTDSAIEGLALQGVKNLVVVPLSFVSEHIETLEEMDIDYAELAHAKGIVNWRRVPALNTNPTFMDDLASMVMEAAAAPAISLNAAIKIPSPPAGQAAPWISRVGSKFLRQLRQLFSINAWMHRMLLQ